MGHLHYYVRDVEANTRFWVALGGEATRLGTTTVVTFPDVLVFLTPGEPSGGTEGSVVNHVAFRVRSLDAVEAAGFKFERSESFPGVTSVFTPEAERIELFDETATNLMFTQDDGFDESVAQRHNEPIAVPIIAHHIHTLSARRGGERRSRVVCCCVRRHARKAMALHGHRPAGHQLQFLGLS